MLPACACMPSFPRPPCHLGELSPQFNETAVGRATLWTPGCCQSLPHHCDWSSPPKGLAGQATESTFSRAGACERTKLRQGFARGLRPPGDDPPLTRRAAPDGPHRCVRPPVCDEFAPEVFEAGQRRASTLRSIHFQVHGLSGAKRARVSPPSAVALGYARSERTCPAFLRSSR